MQVLRAQRRIELRHWSGCWKCTGLGGGGAGTSQSRSLMPCTGVYDLLLLLPFDDRVSLRLANSASDVTRRIPLRGGVMGTGATICPGILSCGEDLVRKVSI